MLYCVINNQAHSLILNEGRSENSNCMYLYLNSINQYILKRIQKDVPHNKYTQLQKAFINRAVSHITFIPLWISKYSFSESERLY
jgi:hypothetical protein